MSKHLIGIAHPLGTGRVQVQEYGKRRLLDAERPALGLVQTKHGDPFYVSVEEARRLVLIGDHFYTRDTHGQHVQEPDLELPTEP